MPPVRKAIIPAAGFGTRFLPIAKAVPKEMLPIVDRPVIDWSKEREWVKAVAGANPSRFRAAPVAA